MYNEGIKSNGIEHNPPWKSEEDASTGNPLKCMSMQYPELVKC
jgi:hypothetical protein